MGLPLPNCSGNEIFIEERRLKPVSPPIGVVECCRLSEFDVAGLVEVYLVRAAEKEVIPRSRTRNVEKSLRLRSLSG